MTTFRCIGYSSDPRTILVRSVASLVGTELAFEKAPQGIPKNLSPVNTVPVLYDGEDLIAFSASAIAKYIVSSAGKTEFTGGDNKWMQASIESWMSYSSEEIERLCEVSSMDFKTSPVKLSKEKFQQAKAQAAQSLMDELENVLEKFLATETFLVGKSITLADIRICSALLAPFGQVIQEKDRKSRLPNVSRWFETCLKQAKLGDFLPKGFSSFSTDAKNQKAATMAPSVIIESKATSSVTSIKTLFRRSRTRVSELVNAPLKGKEFVGQRIAVCGWARTVRSADKGALQFVSLSDGSCFEELQIVCSEETTEGYDDLLSCGGTGSSHRITGVLVESPASGQAVELVAEIVQVLGEIDPLSYPLAKTGNNTKGHSVEFLRQMAHLRARTHLIGAVARVRNACAHAVHQFFNERGFLYVHTPLITASDCEGAGEMFSVTTLLEGAKKNGGVLPLVDAKRAKELESEGKTATVGDIDFTQDFFNKPSFLTVSGQLNVETYACALSDVYTFGPTFRAENSNTSRHLAEFWMIEPELCFATLEDDMNLAEDFIKFCTQYVIDHCASDLEFFEKRFESGLRERLKNVVDNEFKRLKYTEAIDILNQPEHLEAGAFEEFPSWGIDLGSEHERYLTEKVFMKPVILIDYPADIKAFYMRQNEPDELGRITVQAMDILVPKIGEMVGGSAREERLDRLEKRITEMHLNVEDFSWYCDLRRYGSVPHAGFGLGFERLILFVTGLGNIRDAIPFPRYPGHAEF